MNPHQPNCTKPLSGGTKALRPSILFGATYKRKSNGRGVAKPAAISGTVSVSVLPSVLIVSCCDVHPVRANSGCKEAGGDGAAGKNAAAKYWPSIPTKSNGPGRVARRAG